MYGILRATAQAVPKATIYRVAAGVALGSAALALWIAFILRPSMGAVVGYVMWPFLMALVAWVVAGILRLRLVGYLPGQPNDDDFIPRALQPWIRFWLLTRFGLLGAMLALLLAVIAAAVAGGAVNYGVEALVYVVLVRMFMDLGFGAALNLGIITHRRSAG
ncbi:MAG TPA: hypothetical protein VM265_08310 [Sphingomicrobium sp.]|nr:hypothetical protein [Sphingomicrobium sp.]